jgi:hypothetical protein
MKCRFLIPILFLSRFSALAQLDVAPAKLQTRHVTIDGFAKEWVTPLNYYNVDTKLFFSVSNDSVNLYLCFQSKDESNQVKINCAGMSVNLSSKGRKKIDATIVFPLTDSKSRFAEEDLLKGKTPNISELKNTFLLRNTNMGLLGFVTQKGVVPIGDTSTIHAAINWDANNIMTYEIAIPLKELYGPHYTKADFSKAITLTVLVNAVTQPDDESSIDTEAAAKGASTIGQSSGMTRGMPGAGTTRKEKKPIFDQNKFKEKFTINTTY